MVVMMDGGDDGCGEYDICDDCSGGSDGFDNGFGDSCGGEGDLMTLMAVLIVLVKY